MERFTSIHAYTLNTMAKKNFFADFGIKEFVSDGKITQTGAIDKEQEKDY